MNKHCRSKRKFPTRTYKGSGNTKGQTVPGHIAALADIKSKFGSKVEVVKTDHNHFQWVFYTTGDKK